MSFQLPCYAIAAVALLGIVGCNSPTTSHGPVINDYGFSQFKVLDDGLVMGGQFFQGERRNVIGTLAVSTRVQKATWNDEELILLEGHVAGDQGARYFYSRELGAVIVAGSSSWRIRDSLRIYQRWEDVGMEIIRRGRAAEGLDDLMAKLQPRTDVIELFAQFKVIDGQFVSVSSVTHLGKLAWTKNGVTLDGYPSTISLLLDAGAPRGLVVRSKDKNMVLWANGNWYLFANDQAVGAFGSSSALKRSYLMLRDIANFGPMESGPILPSEVRRRAVPL